MIYKDTQYLLSELTNIRINHTPIPSGLSEFEFAALCKYSAYSYDLNQYLRNKIRENAELDCVEKLLNNAVNILPKYKEEGNVFRGTQLPIRVFDAINNTHVYQDKGFFSTSADPERAEHHMVFDIGDFPESNWKIGVFELLYSGEGINLSKFTGKQDLDGIEILLPSNSQFDVIKIVNKIKKFIDGEREMFWITLKTTKIQ